MSFLATLDASAWQVCIACSSRY